MYIPFNKSNRQSPRQLLSHTVNSIQLLVVNLIVPVALVVFIEVCALFLFDGDEENE